MDAAREIQQYAVAGPVNRHLNALRHHGFFIMLVAMSFLIQEFGRPTTGNCGIFTAFVMLILGLWMAMLSLVLRMFPVAAAHIVPPAIAAIQVVCGLRIDLFFSF